jgi:peptidoglycan/LPS O-acetylase OafA/YrhL
VTTTLARPQPVAAPPDGAGRRRDIEGLRAVAVLLVVLYHCGVPFLPGGYVGVDVFFVISGFLITGLLLDEHDRTGRIAVAAFYARRVLRLLPAAVLVVAATVVAAYRWLPPVQRPAVALDAFFTTVYSVNYHLAAAGADYLNADGAPSPLQHFWSLAVEEQFYLVWPVLLLACRRFRRAALSLLVGASLVASVGQTIAHPTWAYFGLHTRTWELGAGALIAAYRTRLPRFLAPVGLAAIAVSAVSFTSRTPFPGYAALLPVLGAAAVLTAGSTAPSRLLTPPPLPALGRLSYSWYLWHWPILLIGPVALGIRPSPPVNLMLAAGSLLAAAVTFAVVENPARYLIAARARPWRAVGAGLLVTVVAAAGYGLSSRAAAGGPSTGYVAPAAQPGNLPALLRAPVPAVPSNLRPAIGKVAADQPRIYRDKCSSELTDATVRAPCVYGDVTSATTVVLFGDSHAGAWFPALDQVARYRRWKLVVITKSACSAASVRIFQAKLNRPFDECVRWRESALEDIAALHPAIVVVTSAAAGGELAEKSADPDAAWVTGWATSADRLTAAAGTVYLIEDTPYQPQEVPSCLSAHPRAPGICAQPRATAFPFPARRAAIRAAFAERGASTIDPTPWFCTATVCPVIVGDVLVYRDASHVTATYDRLLAPMLSRSLQP